MKTRMTPSLIRSQAKAFQGLTLSPTRSKELAQDAARHTAAIAAASAKLEFEDEPSRFLALLQAAREGKRGA